MPAISVTIPVYNVEEYLRRCLDTVIDQTFNLDYEIICVNDGSTDKSPEILAEYAQKYPGMFKIINQENKGLSEARNTALKYVTGKYTMFVDADDFIAQNALEKLYDYAEAHNSEVVIFDFLKGAAGNKNFRRVHYNALLKKYGNSTFNAKILNQYDIRPVSVGTWSKFYLTDFIKKIKFVPGLNNQDICHWAEVYTKANRINYYPVPFYFYVTYRKNSISMQKGKKIFDVFKVFDRTKNVLADAGLFEKFQDNHYVLFASYLMVDLKKIDPELRKEFINEIKNFDTDINYERIFNGNYMKYEKQDIYLIKLIKESDWEAIEKFCYEKRIWTTPTP